MRVSRILSAAVAVPMLAAACSGNGSSAAAEVANTVSDTPVKQDRPAPGAAWVIFDQDTVHAEVASTAAAREKGLMDRDEVPAGTGMLFVFPDSEFRSFWMKNTYVSLDIAFFNESYEIVDIKQMTALDETLVDSEAAANFALEVALGWLSANGIEQGDTAKIVFGPGLRLR